MIPLYVTRPSSYRVYEIDTSLTYKDEAARSGTGGSAYTCRLVSQPYRTSGVSGGSGHLGNVVQNIEQTTGATVTITPVADGSEETAKAIAKAKAAGDIIETEYPFYVQGKRVALKVEITNFDQEVELGRAELWILPKRLHK